jgi:DNA processing protein
LPRSPSSSPDPAIITERLLPPDARFPRALLDLQGNAPAQLWIRGRLDTLEVPVLVAMVGTRRATPYGLRVAREMAGALARAGACVVSGMALGIDAASHRAAIEHGGRTLAVLGTGLDVTYPPAHRALQREIASHGALVSELEPTWSGRKFTFPQRNRIIAALAAATIVVEAPVGSGALITADHALQLGRALAAVPGPIDQPASEGCNRLIRDGALLLASVEEALSLVGLTPVPRAPRLDPGSDEARIWDALVAGPLDMDALASRSGIPATRCMRAVTALELSGALECALTGEIRRR